MYSIVTMLYITVMVVLLQSPAYRYSDKRRQLYFGRVIMAAHSKEQAIILLPCGLFYLLLSICLYSSPNLSGRRLDVYHTSTQWCGLSANLECRSEMCGVQVRWKYRTQKITKESPSGHHCTNLSGYIFATMHVSTIGKKLLNSNVSPSCPHNMVNFRLLSAEICCRV